MALSISTSSARERGGQGERSGTQRLNFRALEYSKIIEYYHRHPETTQSEVVAGIRSFSKAIAGRLRASAARETSQGVAGEAPRQSTGIDVEHRILAGKEASTSVAEPTPHVAAFEDVRGERNRTYDVAYEATDRRTAFTAFHQHRHDIAMSRSEGIASSRARLMQAHVPFVGLGVFRGLPMEAHEPPPAAAIAAAATTPPTPLKAVSQPLQDQPRTSKRKQRRPRWALDAPGFIVERARGTFGGGVGEASEHGEGAVETKKEGEEDEEEEVLNQPYSLIAGSAVRGGEASLQRRVRDVAVHPGSVHRGIPIPREETIETPEQRNTKRRRSKRPYGTPPPPLPPH